MLGGVRVGDLDGVVEVLDEHDRGLPAPDRYADALGVLGCRDLQIELGGDRVGQVLARGHEHGGGVHVVLGLRHQVRRDQPWRQRCRRR